MHAEEFILIPKRLYTTSQPLVQQILENPNIKQKTTQLSLLQRQADDAGRKPETQEKPEQLCASGNVEEIKPTTSEDGNRENSLRENILNSLSVLSKPKLQKTEKILDLILQSDQLTFDQKNNLMVDEKPTDTNIQQFLYNLQQPNKKIDKANYNLILSALDIKPNLIGNTYAKKLSKVSGIRRKNRRGVSSSTKKEQAPLDSDDGFETPKQEDVNWGVAWQSYKDATTPKTP